MARAVLADGALASAAMPSMALPAAGANGPIGCGILRGGRRGGKARAGVVVRAMRLKRRASSRAAIRGAVMRLSGA